MEENQAAQPLHQHLWRQANARLLPSAVLCIAGAVISSANGGVRHGDAGHRFIAIWGTVLFVVFGVAFLHVLTRTIARVISRSHLTTGQAAAIQFVLRIIGYLALFLFAINLAGVPVGKLLLGGAALGIILGVAAQQALANLFASIVLIISHPFYVGEHLTFNSGALGGRYEGIISDIGLTHTRLEDDKGSTILLPNATLLSGATIITEKPHQKK